MYANGKGSWGKGEASWDENYGAIASPSQMAMECLSGIQTLQVKEKANVFEVITAMLGQEIEMGNKYRIMGGPDHPGGPDHELFFAVEQTGFCRRQQKQCCRDCAPWDVDIMYTEGGAQPAYPVFKMKRECTYTCCCFNRPAVDVLTGQGQLIGSIIDPWTCCGMNFTINGPNGDQLFSADGGCCQCGICCPCPCGPCSTVEFPVSRPSGEQVGMVQKQLTCCNWLLGGDVENYKVDFAGVSNPRNKALLMALAIFIDFRYYSDAEQGE